MRERQNALSQNAFQNAVPGIGGPKTGQGSHCVNELLSDSVATPNWAVYGHFIGQSPG